MKHILEHLYSRLDEHADNTYKKLFGKTIVLSQTIKNKLIEAGLDFRHIYDNFTIFENGYFEYTNRHLFTGTIRAKVYKDHINRYIGATDHKYVTIYATDAQLGNDFDIWNPFNYFRAILNALTNRSYNIDVSNIVITSIDYSKKDFEKDSKGVV